MFGLLPKSFEFYDCFDRAVSNAVRASELLLESAKTMNGRRKDLVAQIMEAEHEGDRLAHETLDRLEQTYITPIDREDIHSLVTRIDDVVDMIDAVAQRMMFYKVDAIRQEFIDQCAVLVKASRLMADAVQAVRHMKDRKRLKGVSLDELLIAVHEAEEEGDTIHHQVLAELFECGLDAFQVIKWKELHQLVEEAIDYCDDVAVVVHRIVLKNI